MPAAWEVEDEQDLDTGSTAPSVRVVVPPVSSAAASHVQPAFENNNPGNLEYRGQPGATQNGRYAQFARPEDGYQAMQDQIDLDSKRGSTFGDYIKKYAPPNENDTETYTRNAEAATGANRNIPLAKVDHDKLAAFQAKQESGASVWDVAPDSPYQPGSPAAASGWEVAADSPFQPGAPATPSAAPAQGVIPGMEALGGTPPGVPRPPTPAGLRNQPAVLAPAVQPGTPTPGRQAVYTADNPPPTAGAFGQEKGFAPSRAQAEQFADPQFAALMREAWKGYAGEIPKGDTPAEEVALGLARVAAGAASPESMAYMMGGELAGSMLTAARGSTALAQALAKYPAVAKALDVAAASALPGTFGAIGAYNGISSGAKAIDAYKKGDVQTATEQGTEAAGNLLLAALGGYGAYKASASALAAYPPAQTTVAARPLRPMEQQLAADIGTPATPRAARPAVPPAQAAATAASLQQQGLAIPAQAWQKLAQGNLAEPIPVDIDGQPYLIQPRGNGPDGRPFYQVVDPVGKPIYGGTGGAVQDFLTQRGAAPAGEATGTTPAPPTTPPAAEARPAVPTEAPPQISAKRWAQMTDAQKETWATAQAARTAALAPAPMAEPNAPPDIAVPEIAPGSVIKVGRDTYSIAKVENGEVSGTAVGWTTEPHPFTYPISTMEGIRTQAAAGNRGPATYGELTKGWEVENESPAPTAAETPGRQQNETTPQIAVGAEFQIGTRKYKVQGIDDQDKVTYSIEGATQKPVTLTKPLSVFQTIVSAGSSSVAPPVSATSTSQTETGAKPVSPPSPPLPSKAPTAAATPQEAKTPTPAITISPEQYTARYDRAVQTFSTDHPEWSQTQIQSAAHNWAASGTVTGAPGSAAQPSAAQTPVEQQKERTATAESLVKPKPTDQQTEDIITGTLNPPLTPSGKADAEDRAAQTANVTQINAGPMARTQATAQAASQASANQVPVTTKPALGPWDLGDYQGKPQSEVDDQINHFIAHPDEVVPGGTSYNAYKNPLIGEIQQQVADWKPGDRILNSTHSIGVQTAQAWVANGAPADKSISLDAMLNRQKLEPTSLLRIDPRTMKASFVENTKQDGIFLERHADTPLDNVQQNAVHQPVAGQSPNGGQMAAQAPSAARPPAGQQESQPVETSGVGEVHKFSSTQVNLPETLAKVARAWSAKIPEKSLAEDGREAESHVTLKYGLHDTDPAGTIEALKGESPVQVRFGAISIFQGKTADDPDVLKVDVTSPDLHRFNGKISALPHTDTFPKYSPHLTLAYVKRGMGDKYVGKIIPGLSGKTISLDTVIFSSKDGQRTEIPLAGSGQVSTAKPGTQPAVSSPAPLLPSAKGNDKSIDHLPTRAVAKDGQIISSSLSAGKPLLTITFAGKDWPSEKTAEGPAGILLQGSTHGNVRYLQSQFVRAQLKKAGLDFADNFEIPGREQAINPDRIIDSHVAAINNALKPASSAQTPVEQQKVETPKETVTAPESQIARKPEAIADRIKQEWAAEPDWYQDIAGKRPPWSDVVDAYGKFRADHPTGYQQHIKDFAVDFVEGTGNAQWYRTAETTPSPLAPQLQGGAEPQQPKQTLVLKPSTEEPIQQVEPSKIKEPESKSEPITRAGENQEALAEVPSNNVQPVGEEREAREGVEERGQPDEGSLRTSDRTGTSSRSSQGTDQGAVGVPSGRETNAGTRGTIPSPESRLGSGTDYRITDADQIGTGSVKEKASGNLDAIRTLKQIEADGRIATPDEQKILAKYVGWGGMPQLFKESYYVQPEWQGIRAELDGLLTPDEFTSAAASTPNAHYTSPTVIKAMWDAADRLGLLPKDGLITVLEPSMGVGSFFGLMPEGTEASRVGVELDSITGRIARALYPQSDVHVAGFEKVRLPNDYFDLAISNVPFGNYPVFDPQYKRTPGVTRSIHDYFFAKALDKVRPGGVVAFITSSYTMDKQDPFMRDYLAQRADLVGAIRLPNTAFKASAGTEVTTDIIFLQKRAQEAAPSGEAWTQLKPITGERKRPDGSMGPVEMQVNEYYAAHPEMMLGKMGLLGSQYRDESAALTGNLTPEKLAEAVNRLPENIVSAWKAPVEAFDSVSSIPASGELKDGGYTVQDGKVLVRVGDQLRPTDLSGQQLRSVSGQIKVRDAVHDVFRTQLAGDSEKSIAEAMKKLNTAYDAFVRNNGPLHKKENAKAFADDPDAPVLLALEDWDKETQKAKKADIFSKRVIDTTKPATSADNAKDALSLSLNELGRLDWARMQELTGRTPKELQDELGPLVYQNPSGKAWLPADEYLSGNVRRKLADAEAAAQIDRKFQRNVEALKAVQPIELLPGQIKARLGSSWIPKQEIQQFVSELLDLPLRAVSVGHSEGLGSWTLSLSQKDTVANNRTWGTNRFRGSDLIDDALNLRSPTAYDASKDANGNDIRVINDKETLAAREMQKQIKDKFSEWTWTDPDRSSRLAQIYNEELNSDRLWQPDGSHLTFPGMNLGLKLRPHQKNGVWRIVRGDGNVLLAHVVGSGKTLEIVAGAMELRRLGKSKKPMAVVPNNRVAGTAEEWLRAYPSANILTIGGEDFTPDQRQQMMARIATGNWDGVIVSGEAFTKVPVSDETFNSFLQAQIREYEGFIRDAKADKSDTKIVKELEKAKKRMEAKIRTKNDDVRRDRAISFEDLGVDSLFVDEADLYKNLQFPTKMTRISGIPNTESQRAFDMYLKTQYLTQRNNGRGVIFATGTPVANSMAEVWTMQRYLQPQYLKEHGLQHFDSWAQTFGEVNPALEMTPDGSGVRVTNKFNKFVNMPELIKGFHQVADVQTAKMLQLPVPKLKGGRPTIVSAKASPAQQAYLKTLAERAKKVKGKKPQKGADNILVIGTDGQKAAVDIRLVDPSQPDHPGSKVNMAVDRIVDTWKKTAEKKSTQIVFLDMSTPQPKGRAKGGFSVYEDMRDKLLRRGIPKNEIAFIQDYKGDEPKEELFAAMNAGKVRVLFGSTQAAGVGVNVQKKLIAQHQLDAPYRPRDVEQREGRILRQGNENPEIEIIRYVTEPSFDARKWDILTGKASYINAFMEGDMTVREMEDISDAELSYGEIAAIASGNPAIREKVMVDTEIRKLDAMRSRYEQQEFAIKRDLQALPGTIKADHLEAKKAQKDLDTRDSSPNEFTIGKKTFKGEDGRKNASAALEALLNTRFNEKGTDFGSQTFAIGNYRGFRLVGIDYTQTDGTRREADILIQGELTYRSLNPSPGTAIQSIEAKVRNIEGVRDNWAHSAKESEKKLADTKAIAGQSFEQGDKLKTLLARQAELEKILQTKEPDASAVGGDTDENADGEIETPGDLAELKAKTLTSSLHGSENGPISEYKPGRGTLKAPERAGGSVKEGWLTSEDEGRPIYSNGHILLEGKAPGPETDTSPAFAKSMRDYLHPETAPTPVTPVAYGAPAEKGAAKSIWLSDGTAVDAKYYDHVLKQYPAATFAVGEVKKSGKVIYAQLDGRNIGIVMPLNFPKGAPDAVRPFLNPTPKEEAQADARDVADQRAEGKERGSFSQVTSYEKDARLRKSVAMAEALDAADATPSQAREMTDAQWKMAADLATARAREKDPGAAQIHPPHSDATKKEVIGHLKLIQGIRANAGEHGATPLIGDLYQHLAEKFGADAPRANYKGMGGFDRIFLPGKQLAEVEKASPNVFKSALRAAGSESYAATLMRASIPAIRAALKGSDHSWEELELYYVESRLRGLRDRWNGFADQSAQMTPDEMLDAMKESPDGSGSAFLGLLSTIEGRQGLAQDLGQTALALLQEKDFDNLGKFLTQTFRDAASRVAVAMEPAEFDDTHNAVQTDPQMKEADRLYGELLENPMAESHSLNEGVFSDALGPANRYFPLMAVGRDRVSLAGRRLAYRKPKNQNNSFATGLSDSYDISMDAFAQRLSSAVRGNNKAALIEALKASRWAIPESQAWDNEKGQMVMQGPDGNEYLAVREESSAGRTLIQGRKITRLPAHFIVMPKFVNRALKPILAREPMDPNSVIAVMRWANSLATKGPLELIFHTNGVMGALYANTPFLGDSLPSKVLSAPIAKWFDIRRRMYGDLIAGKVGLWKDPLNPSLPENVKKLLEMSKAGALPARSGKITYSKEYAEETGAKLERLSFGPMLYGPHGIDARARVLMYDIWKAAYPKGDVQSLHHFVNQIGNYIPELQGEIEKWLKHVGLGPFATAGMTRVINGIHTFTGTGPGPGGTWKSRLQWWLTASAAAAIAIWVIAHKELTGKWPLHDKTAKLFEIPVQTGHGIIGKFRHSKLGDMRWGKNNNPGYINLGFFDNPLAMRGARALGLRGTAETMNLGGSGGQAAEAGEADILNTLSGPAMGPAARAAFVGITGDEPYITGFRDYRTGQPGLSMMPAVPRKTPPGWPTAGARALAAAKQLNSLGAEAGENLGALTGLYTADQELPKGAGNWWMRSVLDLAAPGLFANSSNPYGKAAALQQQKRALGVR